MVLVLATTAACRAPLSTAVAGGPSSPRTTAGALAVANLEAEIASLEKARAGNFLTAGRPHAAV